MTKPKKRKRLIKCAKCNDPHDNLTLFRQCLLCPECLNGGSVITNAQEMNELPFVSSALGWSM